MRKETQQNQLDEQDEIQYYKKMLHTLIDDIEDLNILKKIVRFINNVSKWEWK